MPPKSKSVHEAFTKFFENPSRESLRLLLKEHVGELRNCDFKEAWPDHAPLARHLLALGNAEGGCLVLGVAENKKSLTATGVAAVRDKATVFDGVKGFVPASLLGALEIATFQYSASEYADLVGKSFQVVFVHPVVTGIPFVALRDGKGIRAGAVYVRREGQSEEATHDELQGLIAKRIAAAPVTAAARTLKHHLDELQLLYAQVPKYLGNPFSAYTEDLERLARQVAGLDTPNPNYPKEGYEAFVVRVLHAKKLLIERLLGIAKSE